jgi:hypothetical protein
MQGSRRRARDARADSRSRHHETMRCPLVLRPAGRDGHVERLDDEI